MLKHEGKVTRIDENSIFVSILSLSACAACKSKKFCNISESKEKIIEIKVKNPENYEINQIVDVKMQENLGFAAVILAYVLPFVVLFVSLLTFAKIFDNELLVTVISIAAIAIYYFVIKLFSKKIKKKFQFTI
ncbi:MAG: SoxR reducing system RseC family protein [Bacteroidales bacterium]|jgi:sigma-E factor negative regulatory protein RseC|nr:SoxR reducing system RseC family protein [Bacteroidales bacterium]